MDNNDVLDAALELFFRLNIAKPRGDRPAYYKFHAHVVAGVHKRTCGMIVAPISIRRRDFLIMTMILSWVVILDGH